ncbi:unnamed protein product, partial [Vitis vinifera]
MKLNLTTGIIPSLNVSAGLLGFFFVSVWTKFLDKSGLLKQPFTRQENTVIQTCVVASSGIAFSGGFGSYLFGMSQAIAKQSENAGGNEEYKNPAVAWMIGFLFVVSFLGLFSVVPLRKIMIVDFKLTYPSGTATAHLINSFHTPQGAKLAKKQVRVLGKYFSFSFLWGFFQWFFAAGDNCGFAGFPTFGLKAYKYKFFFDFSATYVGVGMICPHIVNISLLVGGILSWGVMWPLIETRKGDWYPADLPSSNIRGLQGYKIFIAIATILGDGLYNFFKVLGQTLLGLFYQLQYKNMSGVPPIEDRSSPRSSSTSYNDTPAISMATLPHIFPQLKWYYILHWSMGWCCTWWSYSRPGSLWSYDEHCINRFRPNAGFQDCGSEYPAPYALVYHNMAVLGVEGISNLPKNCFTLCCVFFGAAILVNLVRDAVGRKRAQFIPIPMAMAIPFYLGPYFAIDMCVGSLILFIWQRINKAKAEAFGPAVASGLICGEGIWTLPGSILALAGIKQPICMKFLSRATNARVDKFLGA